MRQLDMSNHVVIVDDDEISLSIIGSALKSTCATIKINDPEKALATCIAVQPLVVILDIEMPKLNGFEVASQLKANPLTSKISIIFATSHSSSEIEAKALSLGAVDFLSKPLHSEAIALRVSNQLKIIHQAKDLEKANYQLHLEKEYLFVTFSSSDDAVITTNQNMLVTYMNPAAERITGWKADASVGIDLDKVMDLRDPNSEKKAINPLNIALRENRAVRMTLNSKLVNKNNDEFRVKESASPIVDCNGNIVGGVIVFQDVTEVKAMATQLTHMTYHDHLTGLPNRVLLHDRLAMLIKEASLKKTKLALLLVDVDNFKLINDSLGHRGGDTVIKYVANTLAKTAPENATIFRVGGDEFVILLKDVQYLTYSNKVASEILRLAEEQIVINNEVVHISLSVGISLYPHDAKDAEQLMRHADNAMYKVKISGKNSYAYYSPYFTEKLTERVRIERALLAALKDKSLQIYFQPKINMVSGEVTGAEALARLFDKDGSFIPPDEFIPIAEEVGVISSLGRLVLDKSCAQAKQWLDNDIACKVAVNVAAQQFNDPHFSQYVIKTMRKYNLPSQFLELEITESALVSDFYGAKLTLEALKRAGVSVALDDFGTGYSSLSYLHSFELDVIKIDKSFVKEVTSDSQAVCIVKAIIGLAQSLNLKTVCEGVETCEHQSLLVNLGCSEAQGYLYSRPLPSEKFNAFLNDNKLSQNVKICS